MFAPIAKFIDRSVIEMLNLRLTLTGHRHQRTGDGRLQEAVEFLNGPDFSPVESAPARVEFDSKAGGRHFHFPTPRSGEVAENNMVYGRLYRCGERWRERPAVVLLHGGGDFHNHRFGFPWIASRCNRAGFNAVTMELPYQFRRRPRERQMFTKLDYLRLSQIVAQGVAEIRAVIGWLQAEGCPGITLWGVSLGAWLGGMVVCRDPRVNSSVMIAAPNNLLVRVEQIVWRDDGDASTERRAVCDALNRTPLRLASAQPVIRKENILLVQGDYDLFVTSGPMEIQEGWGGPELWRLRQGHIGAGSGMVPGLNGRILRWLAERQISFK